MALQDHHGSFWDGVEAARLVLSSSGKRTLHAWVYIPLGIVLVLLACFGVDRLIALTSVSFPASVACMIIVFLGLLACEGVLGAKVTKKVVGLLEVPCSFALRYLAIFFCPAFVMIPLGPRISGAEVGKVIAVLLLGYVVMFVVTAYLVRAIQVTMNVPKKAVIERAEEMGKEDDEIPLTNISRRDSDPSDPHAQWDEVSSNIELQAPLRAQDPGQITGTGGHTLPQSSSSISVATSNIRQQPASLTRAQNWAAFINQNLDVLTYSTILSVGLPIYFATGYSLPVHLPLNILAYFTALSLPPDWRRFLHPSMVSSVITITGIWVLATCRGDTFTEALQSYQTKVRYVQLLSGSTASALPGAGDVFSSVLDVGIVALALPMFQYRGELKKQFVPIILPTIAISIASLFGYPPLCHALGISPSRSLSFASRSLTLALAQPATQNLGGDMSLVAVLCILSGILGVVIGPGLLKLLKIEEDDYITRGVTLGGNSSAVATALLLNTDPRAAAFSSLSMSLFGTMTVLFTSIPPVVRVVAGLAGVK